MALTDKITVVSEFLHNMVVAEKDNLGIAVLYYGDQEKVPQTPAVCTEPGVKRREVNGAMLRTDVLITVYFMVYHAKVQDVQVTRKEADQLADALEELFHSNLQLETVPRVSNDGLVVHGYVTEVDPGYAMRGGALFRATRLTWLGRSRTNLRTT